MRQWKVVQWMTGMKILWALTICTLYSLHPPLTLCQPARNDCYKQLLSLLTFVWTEQLEQLRDTVKQAEQQSWILIQRSRLVKLYNATLCTLPLDPTSRSGFTTAGRSIKTGMRCEGRQFVTSFMYLKWYFGNVAWFSLFIVNHFTFFTYFTLLSIMFHLSKIHAERQQVTRLHGKFRSHTHSRGESVKFMNYQSHQYPLFQTIWLKQLAMQHYLPQQKLLHLGWPVACISCHHTHSMQHQKTSHHPIFTTFTTQKLRIKGVNSQIFFTIKNSGFLSEFCCY
jgi:hypothetical protein